MRTVNVTVPVVSTACAAGIEPGGIVFSILNADGSVLAAEVAVEGIFSASFSSVADGEYTMTAQAQDSLGALLGTAVSQSFTVADAFYNAPSGLLAITLS